MIQHIEILQSVIKVLSSAVSTVLLIVLFFILQYLLYPEFSCSCKPGVHLNDVVFMAVPALILTSIITLTESFYQKWICSRCCCHCNNFCTSIMMFMLKYIGLTAVWVSMVLFDGDWYFCVLTNHNTNQTGIPCKKDLTHEEMLIRTDYKKTSLDHGFAVITGFFVLWNCCNISKAFDIRRKMWQRGSVSAKELCCPPYYRWVYEDLLSEAVSSHLKEELKEIAKKRAKRLCEKHLKAIRNHELPEQPTENGNGNGNGNDNHNGNHNDNGNGNDNPNGNGNGNGNGSNNGNCSGNCISNGIGNGNGNPNGNENPIGNGSGNSNCSGNCISNGNVNGNGDGNGNVNGNPNGNENHNGNGSGNDNGNDNGNGNGNGNRNNENDNIFEAWQNISYSHFYLMDEKCL